VGIILFEQQQVKKERTASLVRTLDNNADIIHQYLLINKIPIQESGDRIEELLQYMQPELRVTILDWQGNVIYDNRADADKMENHLQRPEIQKSIGFGTGMNIRLSNTNNVKYLYYAKTMKRDILFAWRCLMT